MRYLGDFSINSIVYIPFSTNDGSGGRVSFSATIEVADFKLYKNNSDTQRTSQSGWTLNESFDSNIGIHMIALDLSNNTDSGFYAAGNDYTLVIYPDETVDGQSVSAVVATFSIQNRHEGAVSSGAAGNTFADSYTLTTGTQSSGTITSTQTLDGTNHEHTDGTAEMELYYEFLIGSGSPTSVHVDGYLNNASNNLEVYGYDWIASAWVQIGTMVGQGPASNSEFIFPMFTSMVGTSTNVGKVRIRFYDGAFTLSSATLAIDRIFLAFNLGVGGYSDGIEVDTNASNENTVPGVDGIKGNPVSTWAAALTLSTRTNIEDFRIINGSSITLSGVIDNFTLKGTNWTLDLNGKSVVGAYFEGAIVFGAMSGTGTTQTFEKCRIGAATFIKGTHLEKCSWTGTWTIGEAGDYFFFDCKSAVAGTGTPTLDFAAVGSTNVSIRNYSGGVQVENMGDSGTDTMSLEGRGQIIEGTCTGGTVAIRGWFNESGITNLTLVRPFIGDAAVAGVSATVDNTAFTATNTEFDADDVTEATGEHYLDRELYFISGVLTGQRTQVVGYELSGGRGHFTVIAMTEAPGDNDRFVLV